MKKSEVQGLHSLKYAVMDNNKVVISLHQHPDAAERARLNYRLGEEFTVEELTED